MNNDMILGSLQHIQYGVWVDLWIWTMAVVNCAMNGFVLQYLVSNEIMSCFNSINSVNKNNNEIPPYSMFREKFCEQSMNPWISFEGCFTKFVDLHFMHVPTLSIARGNLMPHYLQLSDEMHGKIIIRLLQHFHLVDK